MHMNQETRSAPAVVRAAATRDSIKVERLTCTIGAELSGISLGDASRDDALFAEIRSLLLAHKVLFLSGQDITRAEHVAFARRFGELEDHPVMASDRDHPGLVLIDKGPDTRAEQYENAWHCDTTWRECPQMGAVLRCTEAPDVGGDMLWADMTLARNTRSAGACAGTASRSGTTAARSTTRCRTSGRRCASSSAPASSATDPTERFAGRPAGDKP
jgi:alpha-ketoglutarate-dependent taurine dioxygenase